jgi:hypothetical protein
LGTPNRWNGVPQLVPGDESLLFDDRDGNNNGDAIRDKAGSNGL